MAEYRAGVRIIAGKYRGRKVPVLSKEGLRPTPNRIRETVFSWLQFDLPDAHVVDAFAGSGAMGIESLSRGAASVRFIERDPTVLANIRQTLQQLGERHGLLHVGDALTQHTASPYDIIFLDPPFQSQLHQAAVDYFCTSTWLKPHGYLYIELPAQQHELVLPAGYYWHKRRQAGQLQFGLIHPQQID